MAYTKNTWGTYTYDESKSLADNLTAAKAANAVVTSEKMNNIENGIAAIELTPGPTGPAGATGAKGVAGATGSAGVGVKSAQATVDTAGKLTALQFTLADASTIDATIITA